VLGLSAADVVVVVVVVVVVAAVVVVVVIVVVSEREVNGSMRWKNTHAHARMHIGRILCLKVHSE
jgi:hypothetical protein